MTALRAFSHYLHAVGQAPLPPLDDAIRAACREPYRRVDRFIQLAVLGAARCGAGQDLGPDCALYLGSGIGPEGNNIVVQEQICRDRLLPRPFNFVNTLGSSATYFVAKDRGLTEQGWWACRRGASLEALLTLALADLELGVCRRALVGVVEECPAPYEDHRARCHAPAGAALAEGSHWLLLEAGAGSNGLELREGSAMELLEALAAAWRPGDRLAFGPQVPAELQARTVALLGAAPFGADLPFHDSLAAARVTAWLAGQPSGRLHLLCGDPARLSLLSLAPSHRAG
jgi:hypothetical protein